MRSLPLKFVRLLAIAALPVVSVSIFTTLAIYSGNADEFAMSYIDILRFIAPFVLGVIVMLGMAGLAMTEQGRARYLSVLSALAVLLWVQSNILVWRYGVLDGSNIDWTVAAWRGVLDIAIWIAVLSVAIRAFDRFGKVLLAGAVASFAIQLLSAGMLLLNDADLLRERDVAANVEGRAAAMRFSPDQNIVHIVMDGFQTDVFAAIMEDTRERDFKSELRGFTFFEQHVGAYPYTQLTVPALLSSKLYRNEQPVDEFITETLRGKTITNVAFKSGYEVDIAAPTALKNVYVQGSHSNAYAISPSGHVDGVDFARSDAAKLVDLALFRAVPHFAKALVHRDQLWVFQATSQANAFLQMQYFSDVAFLNDLAREMQIDREQPVYKLLHVMLSHRPIVANERCEFGGRKPETRDAVRTHAQCGLLGVMAVLQRMKDLGIYDSSLIILMADHGAWLPVENFADTDTVSALQVAMATPVLAVKPPATFSAFQVSNARTSMIDIPATIAGIAGLPDDFSGESVFAIDPNKPRQRHHLTYGYGINPDAKGYLFPMQEYVIDGNPFDAASWRRGERYLPQEMSN